MSTFSATFSDGEIDAGLPGIPNRGMVYSFFMRRFVFLSFLLLGWVFYVLSGGADFVPRGVRPAPVVAARTDPAPIRPTGTLAARTTPVLAPRQMTQAPKPTPTLAVDTPQSVAPRGNLAAALATDQPRGELQLASLAQGAAGLREMAAATETPQDAPAVEETAADIRQITGLRVNMREGPGTIYPVIARLQLGDEVEVLDRSGTGWLRLRGPDRQIGWIAASLVGRKAP